MVVGGWTVPLISMPCWSVPCIINSWMLIQYAVVLTIINKHVEWVNDAILKLGNIDTDVNSKTVFDTKTPLGEPIIEDIINMNYVHKKLCDISQDIENFYAFPVLLGIIYLTATTIFQLRFMIISLTTTSYGFPPTLIYADSGSWSLIALLNLVFLTANVTKTTKEFKKTPLYVHLLLDRCTTDSKTEQALIEFSRDLLHRNVEFSTYGIIVLDGSLLHSIFGTTVTYLIILTQFRVR
ncbi:gustatory and pheromone receptor 32a-like [Microplitis mediator]|uniref:gustatory and pheromone receptor 32a-like n=1 Tax=Microplitis mediator TaxID=375433 RepID=UPI002553FA24|nr:gustatory and pheromone receptor 32a-like [Microplitis mediator]